MALRHNSLRPPPGTPGQSIFLSYWQGQQHLDSVLKAPSELRGSRGPSQGFQLGRSAALQPRLVTQGRLGTHGRLDSQVDLPRRVDLTRRAHFTDQSDFLD